MSETEYPVSEFYIGFLGDESVGLQFRHEVWKLPEQVWLTHAEMISACHDIANLFCGMSGDSPEDLQVTCDSLTRLELAGESSFNGLEDE